MNGTMKSLKRSSIRLKSVSSGHSDLQLAISELKDVHSAAKWMQTSQTAACHDLMKWASKEENRGIQDVMNQISELNAIWTEVQKEFIDNIKDFRRQFEMVLEGDRHVDAGKQFLTVAEQREEKLRREVKKATKKVSNQEFRQLEAKLSEAEKTRANAQRELSERVKENEVVKLIRVKQSLLKYSDAHIRLSEKCQLIFNAQKEIASALPDSEGKEPHEITYKGAVGTKLAVMRAKEAVTNYRQGKPAQPSTSKAETPPPYDHSYPYNPHYPQYTPLPRPISTPSLTQDNVFTPPRGRYSLEPGWQCGYSDTNFNPSYGWQNKFRSSDNDDPSAPVSSETSASVHEISQAMGGTRI